MTSKGPESNIGGAPFAEASSEAEELAGGSTASVSVRGAGAGSGSMAAFGDWLCSSCMLRSCCSCTAATGPRRRFAAAVLEACGAAGLGRGTAGCTGDADGSLSGAGSGVSCCASRWGSTARGRSVPALGKGPPRPRRVVMLVVQRERSGRMGSLSQQTASSQFRLLDLASFQCVHSSLRALRIRGLRLCASWLLGQAASQGASFCP